MGSTNEEWVKHFKSNDTALNYDRQTGGVTKAVANDVITLYSKLEPLEGKIILDNACGTGVVTKQMLGHTNNLKIEAVDIAEPMIAYLRHSIPAGAPVNTQVMNAQVYLILPTRLIAGIDLP